MIETERLILRPYTDADRPALAEINAHPDVGGWLGGVLTREQSDAFMDRATAHIAEHGFGFFAAERKADRRLVGAIGMMVAGNAGVLPAGDIELAWRLHPNAQGSGLAVEGAAACRDWAFANLDAAEVVAITAATNVRSQRVMTKIGMVRDPSRDFDHPKLAEDHPLRRHVFFSVARSAP
ncbi:GNAT family N-acetyltransferase [uncultured Phenylobacterium sp.]|uniref:GNAT family N-acetyltransferase n=1 Tax=uncultured Phenylobacterium sp. TaxID=349273 RepID=UPI0025CCB3F0|nr:GNAT family N-acetyltransferase [uncultured Phenylobacterium sp.]